MVGFWIHVHGPSSIPSIKGLRSHKPLSEAKKKKGNKKQIGPNPTYKLLHSYYIAQGTIYNTL